ncbi:vWA-like protein [Gymnopus androsaceus JB14]|uniref:VWA-like protein n=1 Tax=Gymnopus androsaceus JB14 TaxID=1447944 RepID=A0A6A4HZ35_9AGAR|nr:vWA-like protein [Gymnopus androsaceus JB14]
MLTFNSAQIPLGPTRRVVKIRNSLRPRCRDRTFSPVPQNAQVSLPGFQGSLQRYGSPTPYTNIPPRVGTPGTNSKKQQWIQQSTKNTRMIQSGQFQASAIAWIFVSNDGAFPPNAINFGNESNQSFFICRSFYENQLRVGKVFLEREGPRALVICKGKECRVRDYEVLVQSFALPQFSFVPNTSTASTHFPIAQPAAAPILSGIDIVFVVDDSDSMEGDRWNDVRNALSGVAHDCGQFDEDGFDLHFLNNEYFQQNINNSESITQAFSEVSPDGATPTGERLRKVLETCISRLEDRTGPSKPVGIIVITDGDPTDDVESVIVAAAQRLESAGVPENQLYIHFIQIGDDLAATNALQRLDNALSGQHGIRDIVDTTVSQTQFRTQTLYSTIQTMWKKQTNETLSPAMAGISTSQSFSPLPMSPLPSSYALSPTISEVQSSNNSGYHTGRQNTLSFAHGGPQTQPPSTSGFVNRMDWVQQAQQLTATLKSSANLNSMVPYAWIFVDHDVAPSDAIVCGNENGQDAFLCRSFYQGQLRYGNVMAGSMNAVIFDNGREIPVIFSSHIQLPSRADTSLDRPV